MEPASDATGCVDGAGRGAPRQGSAPGISEKAASTAPTQGGLKGPALWIAAGVMVGASVTGALSVAARQSPIEMRGLAAGSTDSARALHGEGAHEVDRDDDAAIEATPGVIGRRIDLNTATQAELELLPGIGPTMAQRIVEDREQRGAFRRIEDLDRIRGMGERIIDRLRPMVRVGAEDNE
jgi:competence protein ComEA